MRLLTTCLLILSSYGILTAQQFEKPIDYIKFFNAEFMKMQQLQVDYAAFLAHTRTEVAARKQRRLLSYTQKALQKFDQVKKFKDDKNLKQNAVRTIELMVEVAEKDYAELAEKKAKCENCFQAVETEYNLSAEDFKAISSSIKNIQKSIKDFAKAHNIKLVVNESKHNELVSKINQTNAFTRQSDLAMLEVQLADAAIIRALNEKDNQKASEALKEMHKAIGNATKRLKKINKFAEAENCLKTIQDLVAFYKDAAKNLYPEMIKTFDDEGKVINEHVKGYNTAINALNEGAAKVEKAYKEAEAALEKKLLPDPNAPAGP